MYMSLRLCSFFLFCLKCSVSPCQVLLSAQKSLPLCGLSDPGARSSLLEASPALAHWISLASSLCAVGRSARACLLRAGCWLPGGRGPAQCVHSAWHRPGWCWQGGGTHWPGRASSSALSSPVTHRHAGDSSWLLAECPLLGLVC